MSPDTYELDSAKLDQALEILRREREALESLARMQRRARPYGIAFFCLFAVICSTTPLAFRGWMREGVLLAMYLLLITYGGLLIYVTATQIHRVRSVQHALGKIPLSWFYELQQRRGVPVLLLALAVLSAALPPLSAGKSLVLDLAAVGCAVATVLIFDVYLRRTFQPVANLISRNERLQAELSPKREGLSNGDSSPRALVRDADYKTIAQIERGLVSLDRERALEDVQKSQSSALPVLLSSKARRAKSHLQPGVRLEIEKEIEDLSSQRPSTEVNAATDEARASAKCKSRRLM